MDVKGCTHSLLDNKVSLKGSVEKYGTSANEFNVTLL